MKKYLTLLILLFSSITITGLSFIDGKLWNIIFAGIGFLSYEIVGIMFSFGLIKSKRAGGKAYVFIMIILLLTGFAFYQQLIKFQTCILFLPLFWKILVPTTLWILTLGALILVIIHWNKEKNYYD